MRCMTVNASPLAAYQAELFESQNFAENSTILKFVFVPNLKRQILLWTENSEFSN